MAKNTSFITRPGIAYWYLQSPDQKYDSKYKTGLMLSDSKDLRETINKTFLEQFGDKKLSDLLCPMKKLQTLVKKCLKVSKS